MTIYKFLEKKQKHRAGFQKGEEFEFYIKNREVLNKIPRFSFLMDADNNDFDVMRANILIQSYFNKVFIEDEIRNVEAYKGKNETIDHIKFISVIKNKLVNHPYFLYNKIHIYLPFFNVSLNEIYLKESEKILAFPYDNLMEDFSSSIIDPFDLYGPELYDSYFTKLIKIGTNGREVAFFHYDTNTIYIVNSQGRLDNKIVLFDRYIKRPKYNHMLERLKPVVEAYFNNNRANFLQSLYDNEFLSEKLFNMMKREDILTR